MKMLKRILALALCAALSVGVAGCGGGSGGTAVLAHLISISRLLSGNNFGGFSAFLLDKLCVEVLVSLLCAVFAYYHFLHNAFGNGEHFR